MKFYRFNTGNFALRFLTSYSTAYTIAKFTQRKYAMPARRDAPLSVILQAADQSPAKLVQQFKRISGLTWAQVASVFEVSRRTPLDWVSGKPINAKNHKKLGLAVAAIRFIDRGAAEENCNLLLSEAVAGRTYLDLLQAGEFEYAQQLAGEGAGRPGFGQELTAEATMLNAPRHFGASIESGGGGGSEILPVSKPKLRRAQARQNRRVKKKRTSKLC